jgi:hypothetical protein
LIVVDKAHDQRMRFGCERNVTVFLVTVSGGLHLLISETNGFVSTTRTRKPATATATATIICPLHRLNANRFTVKQKLAEHDALSHLKQYTPYDNVLISSFLPPKQQPPHDHINTLDKTFVAGFLGLFVAILYKLLKNSSPGSWRYFLAGGLCAASSHAIPTPIDVIKVWLLRIGRSFVIYVKESFGGIPISRDYFVFSVLLLDS